MIHIDCVAVYMLEVKRGGNAYAVPCWDCEWNCYKAQLDDAKAEFWIPDTQETEEMLQKEWDEWQKE